MQIWKLTFQCSTEILEVKCVLLFVEQGPGGVWCDVDVVEFSYFGAPAATPKEQLYNELVDGLRGSDPYIGSGSQVCFVLLILHNWLCSSNGFYVRDLEGVFSHTFT